MISVWPNSTGCPSFTIIFFTVPSEVEGMWFIVFIASTIIIVWPFLTLSPTFTKGLPPGSGAKYAVPIIGDFIRLPSASDCSERTALLEETNLSDTFCPTKFLLALETFIFLSPSWYSSSVRLNSDKSVSYTHLTLPTKRIV